MRSSLLLHSGTVSYSSLLTSQDEMVTLYPYTTEGVSAAAGALKLTMMRELMMDGSNKVGGFSAVAPGHRLGVDVS